MIFAVINEQTNIVNNTVVLNEGSQWTPPLGDYIVDITGKEVGVDWVYNPITKQWTPPTPPAPLETPIDETSGSAPNVIE